MTLETPVLFLVFNRPDTTKLVFEQIRIAKPKQLFIAADGPRDGNQSDQINCEEVKRFILGSIDWDCQVSTLFREENLGCGQAVSNAISWFFDHVDEGIILEDDCLPSQSFFSFCSEILNRYRNDPKIMSISGSNLLGRYETNDNASYFSAHGGIWGWATWKRAWKLYDVNMQLWRSNSVRHKIKKNIGSNDWFKFYYPMFESSYNKQLDSWDLQWFYTILINDGVALNPSKNLVKNIGFNADGTHTKENPIIDRILQHEIDLPLQHNNNLNLDRSYLSKLYRKLNPSTPFDSLKGIFRSLKSFLINETVY